MVSPQLSLCLKALAINLIGSLHGVKNRTCIAERNERLGTGLFN